MSFPKYLPSVKHAETRGLEGLEIRYLHTPGKFKEIDEVELEAQNLAARRSHHLERQKGFDALIWAGEKGMYTWDWDPDGKEIAALQSAVTKQRLGARVQGYDLPAHCMPFPEMML